MTLGTNHEHHPKAGALGSALRYIRLSLVLAAACGSADGRRESPEGGRDSDTFVVDPVDLPQGVVAGAEPFATPTPDLILDPNFQGCILDGVALERGEANVYGDCVICQCTTFGARCSKRAGCVEPLCVLANGKVLAVGEAANHPHCFRCTCTASGPACVRVTTGGCPADACLAGYFDPQAPTVVIPVGAEYSVSECHACACDAVLGATCHNFCHPTCQVGDDHLPDQSRFANPDGCGACLCDYGGVECDTRACD